jgi:O-antigen ligase
MFIILIYIVANKKLPTQLVKSKTIPLFLLFLLINFISTILSPYTKTAFNGYILLILDLIFLVFNLIMLEYKGFIKWIPLILIISVSINNFLAILGSYLHVQTFIFRGRGVGGTIDPNNAALMTNFITPLILNFLFSVNKLKEKLIYFVFFIINLLGILTTESRAGFLVFLLVVTITLIVNRKIFHPKNLGLIVAAFSILISLGIFFTPQTFVTRIISATKGANSDVSTRRRLDYQKVGLKAFYEKPFIGWGTLTFKRIWYLSDKSLKYAHTERPAHNTYLEVLVGTGIIGLTLFVFILLRVYLNFNYALKVFINLKNKEFVSVIRGYKIGFLAVLFYFFFKSGIEHKYFLLALPLSDFAYILAQEAVNE